MKYLSTTEEELKVFKDVSYMFLYIICQSRPVITTLDKLGLALFVSCQLIFHFLLFCLKNYHRTPRKYCLNSNQFYEMKTMS